jgi:hypothetical protein
MTDQEQKEADRLMRLKHRAAGEQRQAKESALKETAPSADALADFSKAYTDAQMRIAAAIQVRIMSNLAPMFESIAARLQDLEERVTRQEKGFE